MCWEALNPHLLARIAGLPEDSTHAQTATMRLICQAWKHGIDVNIVSLAPSRWPDSESSAGGVIASCQVSVLNLSRLCAGSDADISNHSTSSKCSDVGDAGTPVCGSVAAMGSCSSLNTNRHSRRHGRQLDLTGAAVLQPRMSSRLGTALAASSQPGANSVGSMSAAAAVPTCYLASMWPNAVPWVTPMACYRMWRSLLQLTQLRELHLSGSMLPIASVRTAVAGCPDTVAGLVLLQQMLATHSSDGESRSSVTVPTITHTYSLQLPAELCTLTGLKALTIEWQFPNSLQQQHSVRDCTANSSRVPMPVRRRSYEGCGSCNPEDRHVADPCIRLPDSFSCLVSLQRLQLVGSISETSTLLPLTSLSHLKHVDLGPGEIAVQALVPLATAGTLQGLTQLVLKQQSAWDVTSLVAVLATLDKLQELEVQELNTLHGLPSNGGSAVRALLPEHVSAFSSTLRHLRWAVCAERLSAGASLLCTAPAAAVTDEGLVPGSTTELAQVPVAGHWLAALTALQSLELMGILHDGSMLGGPALQALSSSIKYCQQLQSLSIKRLGLPLLPQELALLPQLRSVAVDTGGMVRKAVAPPEQLLAVLGRCMNLQDLSLSACELRQVPEWLADLQHVTALRLHSNFLQDLPSGRPFLGLPQALQVLDLKDNRLREVPTSITDLQYLTQLVLDSNYLSRLPGTIWDLPALEQLSARDNMLSELPECTRLPGTPSASMRRKQSMSDCSTVPGADVGCREIMDGRRLPNAAHHALPSQNARTQDAVWWDSLLDEEQELLGAVGIIHTLSVRSARDSSVQAAASAHCTAAARPDLGGKGQRQVLVAALQVPCACASSLCSLDLAANQLRELPDSISQLTNLHRLNLSQNQLHQLPPKAGVWGLSRLTQLQLAHNHLTLLPAGLARLRHLVELDVSGNHLSVTLASKPQSDGWISASACSGAVAAAAHSAAAPAAAAVSAAVSACRRLSLDGGRRSTDQSTSAAALAAANGSNAEKACSTSSAPALGSCAMTTPASAPANPRTAHWPPQAISSTPTVLVDTSTSAADSSDDAFAHRFVKQHLHVLPRPLAKLPELQQVRMGQQQPRQESSKAGLSPLQLLLGGLCDLAEMVKRLGPHHQCPVSKAAAAAVAHVSAVARSKAHRQRLLDMLQVEQGCVKLPAKTSSAPA